jgi:bifunctional non-homologous end joining protein LigD
MDPPPAGYEPMPDRIRPMLAHAAELPADDDGWAYESKWDGVRAIAYVEGGRVRAFTRNDKDVTSTFPELRELGEFLGARSAVLDGELVAFEEDGRPSFGRLQHRLHVTSSAAVARRAREVPVTYMLFDLLYLDGHLLVGRPYDERRVQLESLQLAGRTFATTDSLRGVHGPDVVAAARESGLEGIVAKRRDSPYRPGRRSADWRKVKNFRAQEVVVGGWTDGKGERQGSLGALLLGIPGPDGLTFVGKVGTGFSEEDRRELLELLRQLEARDTPFSSRLSASERALAHFVDPTVVGEVQYGEWTSDGRLRHPSWRGLRPDKDPSDVVHEP